MNKMVDNRGQEQVTFNKFEMNIVLVDQNLAVGTWNNQIVMNVL